MTKLCVTTNNGLYPLGHAQALATVSKSLADRWIQGVGGASVGPSQPPSQGGTPPAGVNAAVYAKSDLRSLSLSLSLSLALSLSLSRYIRRCLRQVEFEVIPQPEYEDP